MEHVELNSKLKHSLGSAFYFYPMAIFAGLTGELSVYFFLLLSYLDK